MDKFIADLRAAVGRDSVLAEAEELLVYECDGLPQHKYRPRAVVFPSTTEETAAVMSILAREGVPFTPRGAGTGLSGGALALNNGVVISMARMRKILRIDQENRFAVVQTGVVNSHVSRAVAHLGLHYVPDPSSQPSCTIGGNLAENAGGIHCLKYGTTTDHVLAARVVLSNGNVTDIGSVADQPGYDLIGAFVGSEGTFGIATEATLRLVPIPPAVRTLLADFIELDDASRAVSAIIAAGVIPAALEMMDREIIRAVEASPLAAGLPVDAGGALLIELDGLAAGIDDEAERLRSICLQQGARACRLARDENERKKLWAARKGAFGAISRIAPDSMIQDAVVPRSRLPEVLAAATRIAAKYQLRLANVFHAGDGNLHPLICFDSRSADQVARVKEAGRELMETCVRAGGSISGEHGVGLDKREYFPLIFNDDDMDAMLRVRAAFDPIGILNPGKIIPTPRGCGEGRAVAIELTACTETKHITTTVSVANAEPKAVVDAQPHVATADQMANNGRRSSLSPTSFAEFSEAMQNAPREKRSVVVTGAATWLDEEEFGGLLAVSTRNLNRIVEHEPGDMIATTQAGVRLADFNAELSKRGQWLPLDPPDDGRATVGGVLATGLSGTLKTGYGSPRNFVIGMKVVLANGTLIKMGGRVVKNVAGYELGKLFTGSYGTLGAIVEATFKLRPLPEALTTIAVYGEFDGLCSIARGIMDTPLFPVSTEIVSPQFFREAMRRSSATVREGSAAILLVRYAGSSSAVSDQVSRTIALAGDTNEEVVDDVETWRSIAAMPLRSEKDCIWRASVLPNRAADFLKALSQTNSKPNFQLAAAEGRFRVFEDSNFRSASSLADLRRAAVALGGSLVIERAPIALTDEIGVWGDLAGRAALMRQLKSQLDPQNVLPDLFSIGQD